MLKFECNACGYIYDEKKEKVLWKDLPNEWLCLVCESGKNFFEQFEQRGNEAITEKASVKEYLSEWKKPFDELESCMADIHKIAETGESITEPMRSKKPVISWDDLIIKGVQLAKLPLDINDPVNTKTIIGINARYPLIIETPLFISHMSFGALSREIKTALAKGSSAVKSAICSGEGGILKDEIDSAYKYIFEYVPNEYSVNEINLQKVDAIEIKIGQSAKPGMGGHLPGDKVTEEIAMIRGRKTGEDIHSPSSFKDIKSKAQLKAKVDWLREVSGGKPVGVKIAAGHIEEDLEFIIHSNPDFITLDGRAGATGSAPKFIKDSSSIPTVFALYRAREYFNRNKINGISLIITGGLRISSDFAKAIAMGADAVAIATSAMIAAGCQQYRICNTGKCPVGIATHDPELRKRLSIDLSAKRVENFLRVSTDELKTFARITGNNDVHNMSLKDLCTTNSEISNHTKIEHIGGIKNE